MGGLTEKGASEIAEKIGIHPKNNAEVTQILLNLYKLFQDKDASMVEINPFAEDSTGNFVCLDAKLKVDDNADFRQKEIFDLRDWSQVNALFVNIFGEIMRCDVIAEGIIAAARELD